nr:MAG TPA: putative tail fiber protein [Caudoviricetes sp.]
MATNTTNYNFKKPDESDFYSVQDQNNNWDKADAALKDLDTPTFEDYSGSTTVPDAATAIGNIKSKGKLSTTFSNIKAAFKGACLIGQIINNCVTNNAKLPLSAAQGKALMDLYTKLNSDLGDCYKLKNKRLVPSGADLNNYRTPGTYLINSADLSTILNKPTGWTATGGIILVEDWVDPKVVTMTVKTYNGSVFWRNYLSGTWTEWVSGTVTTDLSTVNPSSLILQSRSTGYPKPTFFADSAGALFMRCYLNATDYYELSLNSVGAYVNKCIGGKIVFTNKFVTF